MNKYKELSDKHQQETNNFPIAFAFSNSQFEEGMKKLGLLTTDTDKVCSIYGGGFIRKTDKEAFIKMFKNHKQEMGKAITEDKDNFIYDMFYYELSNHEYCYTGEIDQTIESLGFTYEEIQNNSKLKNALNKACKDQKAWDLKHG